MPLGVWAGRADRTRGVDNLGSIGGFFGISMPNFWLGIMLVLLVSGYLNLLPSSGRNTFGLPQDPITGFLLLDSLLYRDWAAFKDALAFILMPAFVLGVNDDGHPDAGHALGHARDPVGGTSS